MEERTPGHFTSLPVAVRSVWAKSDEGTGHGLLAHLLDVAAVTEVLLQHEPAATREMAARALGLNIDRIGRWLAAFVGLHDLDKAIRGFQAKRFSASLRIAAMSVGFRRTISFLDNEDRVPATERDVSVRTTALMQGWPPRPLTEELP